MTRSIDVTQGDLPIRGTHVILRDWRNEDLEPFRHWLGPGHAWHRFDGPYYALGTPEQTNASVELRRRLMETGSFPSPRVDLVIADAIDDRLIGRVNRYWISEETDWLALGIALYDERSWGRGLGTEAFGLWCEYLWRAMPRLVRLDFRTWSGNHGMQAIGRRLGFREEARFRMARIVDGDYHDGLGFGVLRTEWEARYPDRFGRSGGTSDADVGTG